MAELKKSNRLKKDLNLSGVYAIATGTTLSAGFFLLPGLAAKQAGAGIVLAYLVAAIPLIPAVFSIIELSTAMPRAGGVYYFMDRALGPYFGTIGGIGTWLALILKVSFALIGMGAYIALFFPELPVTPIAVALAVLLGILNLFGAKKSGGLQIFLVFILLVILILFIAGGIPEVTYSDISNVFDIQFHSLISTAGLVYISYVGVTKIASLSEEVENPDKNLPRGILLAIGSAIIIYGLGTLIMVSVMPVSDLANSLTPVADAGKVLFGKAGAVVLTFAAMLAFISVANAGTMSASRYPLAMSRDHLVPRLFKKLSKQNTPVISVVFTVSIIVVFLVFFNPMKIAKLASAFQLLMFALVCLGVIIMRESKIESYDPGYKSPLYPWMQIVGIVLPLYFITEMGFLPIAFSLGLIILATVWYFAYAREKVIRNGAIYHVFERLGQRRYQGLDSELRGILKEKGLRDEDPFDDIVMRSKSIEIETSVKFEYAVGLAADYLTTVIDETKEEIVKQFMEGTRIGATPVTHGFALPHFRSSHISQSELVLLRCKEGISIKLYDPISHKEEGEEIVNAVFFLVSPEDNPTMHLRILAQVAGRVDEDNFMHDWLAAENEMELKEILLHDDRFVSLCLKKGTSSEIMIGEQLQNIKLPSGILVALLKREGAVLIPKGNTILEENDRLTIIGDKRSLSELKEKFSDSKPL